MLWQHVAQHTAVGSLDLQHLVSLTIGLDIEDFYYPKVTKEDYSVLQIKFTLVTALIEYKFNMTLLPLT